MKLFSGFFKRFSIDKQKVDTQIETIDNQKIVQLVEPNSGRVVTLQVFAEESVLHMMVDLLTSAKGYSDAQTSISGNIVTFTFSDDHLAELFRLSWQD